MDSVVLAGSRGGKGKSVGEPSNPMAAGSGGGMVKEERKSRRVVRRKVETVEKPMVAGSRGGMVKEVRKRQIPVGEDLESWLESLDAQQLQDLAVLDAFILRRRIKDCRNPEPPERCEDLLAVFALELIIVDEKQLPRNLHCIVTVDYDEASEDIYNGKLPIPTTAAAGHRIVLQLTGPGNFITANDLEGGYGGVFFAVSLVDEDSDESVALSNPHECNANCLIKHRSCGTYPAGSFKGSSPGLFVWCWTGIDTPDEKVVSVDLLKCLDGIRCDFNSVSSGCRARPPSYGCSLNLVMAAFRNAVVAKVKVVLVKPATHNICSCGCGLGIYADCGYIYQEIILFRKDKCSCSQRTNENNIIETTSPEKVELELSRSLVTMPAPTHPPLVLKVVLASLQGDAVGGSASFPVPVQSLGTTDNKPISRGSSGEILLEVTVKWM